MKRALESYGLSKVSFGFNGEMVSVATNDKNILEFLNPISSNEDAFVRSCSSSLPQSIVRAWEKSCRETEAMWNRVTAAVIGLDSTFSTADGMHLQGGEKPKQGSPYTILPSTAAMSKDKWDCPYMPRQAGSYQHTPHRSRHQFVYNAAVSRPVSKSEIRSAGKDETLHRSPPTPPPGRC